MKAFSQGVSRRTFLASALAAGALAVLPLRVLGAEREEWVRLGVTRVSHKAEKDAIEVGPAAGPFRAIKLVVHDADVRIYRMRILFREGPEQAIEFKEEIRREHETPAIDLPGHRRVIERIILAYKTPADEAHAARVEVYGIR